MEELMKDGFTCRSIWAAAALMYVGYALLRIDILNPEGVEFHFDAESLDAQLVVEDYENGRLALTDAKAYSLAFTKLQSRLRDVRKRGETSWLAPEHRAPDNHSPEWWATARENAAKLQRERDERERENHRKHR
jgi:hypothetical protein